MYVEKNPQGKLIEKARRKTEQPSQKKGDRKDDESYALYGAFSHLEKEKTFNRKFERALNMHLDASLIKPDLSKCGLTKTIARHFFVPSLKLILFPMFLIIGGIMAGNLTDESGESEALLAGFGLGELSVAILSLTILHAFNRNMKEKFEEEFLNDDHAAMQVLLYQ